MKERGTAYCLLTKTPDGFALLKMNAVVAHSGRPMLKEWWNRPKSFRRYAL
jgi:hypothetical protein